MAKQTTALSAGVNRGEAAGQQEFRSVPRHPAAGPDMALGKPRVSVVVPARNQSENIVPVLGNDVTHVPPAPLLCWPAVGNLE